MGEEKAGRRQALPPSAMLLLDLLLFDLLLLALLLLVLLLLAMLLLALLLLALLLLALLLLTLRPQFAASASGTASVSFNILRSSAFPTNHRP